MALGHHYKKQFTILFLLLFVPLVNDVNHHKIHGAIESVLAVVLVNSDR